MNSIRKVLAPSRILSSYKHLASNRSLYSPASIGVVDYERVRQKFNSKIDQLESFRNKMRAYVEAEDQQNNMIFTDDLKQMVHITQATEEDLSLIHKMMKKFNQQNAHLRFGTYNFGPVIMRMYHYFNKPDEALKVYYDPELDGFFDQLSTVIILLDLLFVNKRYTDVLKVYKTYRSKQLNFGKFPKSIMVLVFGACYQINTKKLLDYSLELWKEMNEMGFQPLRRVTCFLAALALNQNDPHTALEITSAIPGQNYVLVRCIKALSYCALGRVDDVLPILTSVLTFDSPNVPKMTFPQDVITAIKEAVEKQDDKTLQFEFNRIEKQLTEQGHVSNNTLDNLLCSEVTVTPPVNKTRSVLHAAFKDTEEGNRRGGKHYNMFRRPGLQEII